MSAFTLTLLPALVAEAEIRVHCFDSDKGNVPGASGATVIAGQFVHRIDSRDSAMDPGVLADYAPFGRFLRQSVIDFFDDEKDFTYRGRTVHRTSTSKYVQVQLFARAQDVTACDDKWANAEIEELVEGEEPEAKCKHAELVCTASSIVLKDEKGEPFPNLEGVVSYLTDGLISAITFSLDAGFGISDEALDELDRRRSFLVDQLIDLSPSVNHEGSDKSRGNWKLTARLPEIKYQTTSADGRKVDRVTKRSSKSFSGKADKLIP